MKRVNKNKTATGPNSQILPRKEFMRVSTVAQMLDVSKGHVWNLIKSGALHSIKLSAQITVLDTNEVEEFIGKYRNQQAA